MTSLLVDAFDAVATAVCSLAFENISRSKRERGDGKLKNGNYQTIELITPKPWMDMTSLLVDDAFDAVATAVCSLAFENISRSKRERGDGSIRKQ
jgi:hypothetical protein